MPIPPREECKFPGARAGHSSATRSFLPRKKVFDLDRGRGQGGANKKVMKRGETNSLAERNNIRGRYSRFVEAAGPFDSDRGRKETRADSARRSWPPFNRTKLRVITRERALKRLRLKGIRRGGRSDAYALRSRVITRACVRRGPSRHRPTGSKRRSININ